jgi:hypothetical protein
MGANRACDAAPDSQPWEAHYKPGIVNIRFACGDVCNSCRKLTISRPFTTVSRRRHAPEHRAMHILRRGYISKLCTCLG